MWEQKRVEKSKQNKAKSGQQLRLSFVWVFLKRTLQRIRGMWLNWCTNSICWRWTVMRCCRNLARKIGFPPPFTSSANKRIFTAPSPSEITFRNCFYLRAPIRLIWVVLFAPISSDFTNLYFFSCVLFDFSKLCLFRKLFLLQNV